NRGQSKRKLRLASEPAQDGYGRSGSNTSDRARDHQRAGRRARCSRSQIRQEWIKKSYFTHRDSAGQCQVADIWKRVAGRGPKKLTRRRLTANRPGGRASAPSRRCGIEEKLTEFPHHLVQCVPTGFVSRASSCKQAVITAQLAIFGKLETFCVPVQKGDYLPPDRDHPAPAAVDIKRAQRHIALYDALHQNQSEPARVIAWSRGAGIAEVGPAHNYLGVCHATRETIDWVRPRNHLQTRGAQHQRDSAELSKGYTGS
ncbi:MAG TPA: hypothetical protein VFP94_05685, partial [Terriglobales bacterium]|nr:hypothetical protein [Terriglobales bacterium]